MSKYLIYISAKEGSAQAYLAFIRLKQQSQQELIFQHGGAIAKNTLQECSKILILGEVEQTLDNMQVVQFCLRDAVVNPLMVLTAMNSLEDSQTDAAREIATQSSNELEGGESLKANKEQEQASANNAKDLIHKAVEQESSGITEAPELLQNIDDLDEDKNALPIKWIAAVVILLIVLVLWMLD
ncbi:hypothetical protein [Rappaport israeli]|uniref:hypothetical protein n=1 Tax=Rappaport israeli TaxID=1839807 RepID=UPI000931AFA0|nr:hypothetical protein [Rappaport israeli]